MLAGFSLNSYIMITVRPVQTKKEKKRNIITIKRKIERKKERKNS